MLNLVSAIKACKIFSSLDDEGCLHLIQNSENISLRKEEVLFYQGDESDALYLVILGELKAVYHSHGHRHRVGFIHRGEIVGELGAISLQERSLTVVATMQTSLIKIPYEVFIELCNKYPSISLDMMKCMIERSQGAIRLLNPEHHVQHVLLINTIKNDELFLQLKQKLIFLLEKNNRVYIDESMGVSEEDINRIVLEKSKGVRVVYYFINQIDCDLARVALERAHTVYLVVNCHLPQPDWVTVFQQLANYHIPIQNRQLVLLKGETKTTLPLQAYIENHPISMHYSVDVAINEQVNRFYRFLTGTAVGLVLGGGGAKGWAHIGVLRALHELGIEVDIICGASIGALVGAFYAKTIDYFSAKELFSEMMFSENPLSIGNFTWPKISLLSSKKNTDTLKSLLQDSLIEHLPLPFICVSSNLTKKKLAVHKTGKVWEKLRASVAVPGLLPPMVIDGDIHYDGGLLDNLPVHLLKTFMRNEGRIIAVQLSHFRIPQYYRFPPILTLWDVFFQKMGWTAAYDYPPFIDTMLKALLLGSAEKEHENAESADILIQPRVDQFGMLSYSKSAFVNIEEEGYTSAILQLQKWKK